MNYELQTVFRLTSYVVEPPSLETETSPLGLWLSHNLLKSTYNYLVVITTHKRSLRRLYFYRCLSFCPQGGMCMLVGGVCGCSWGGMCGCSSWGGMHGCSGGHAWLLRGGCAWLLLGGMCGCSRGGMVAPGGHAWLLPGGACVVALGGMCVVALGGMHGCSRGECVVAPVGGHAWLLWGGMRGCSQGGFFRWDMVNEQAVCILLECILVLSFILWPIACILINFADMLGVLWALLKTNKSNKNH